MDQIRPSSIHAGGKIAQYTVGVIPAPEASRSTEIVSQTTIWGYPLNVYPSIHPTFIGGSKTYDIKISLVLQQVAALVAEGHLTAEPGAEVSLVQDQVVNILDCLQAKARVKRDVAVEWDRFAQGTLHLTPTTSLEDLSRSNHNWLSSQTGYGVGRKKKKQQVPALSQEQLAFRRTQAALQRWRESKSRSVNEDDTLPGY